MLAHDAGSPSGPQVEFVMVADRAEVVSGKLYVMGGAWEHTLVMDFDVPIQISVAISILVPWNATNQHHQLGLSIDDADARNLTSIQAAFVVGRPAHLDAGSSQRVASAFPVLSLKLPGPGTFVVRATVNGDEQRQTTFHAAQGPHQSPMQQGSAAQA